ncbi:hypothetical protein QR680_006166 [Steinernema hermaphroditum]|uniref:F-box domain-containing protein n=1 Tax=Steinernema hermaphroditum TaxID=289476 RepID=A0AA39HUI9_9BILA|nr:hypothetical protein QR680_006166 [Steinernema hermaphroditum]
MNDLSLELYAEIFRVLDYRSMRHLTTVKPDLKPLRESELDHRGRYNLVIIEDESGVYYNFQCRPGDHSVRLSREGECLKHKDPRRVEHIATMYITDKRHKAMPNFGWSDEPACIYDPENPPAFVKAQYRTQFFGFLRHISIDKLMINLSEDCKPDVVEQYMKMVSYLKYYAIHLQLDPYVDKETPWVAKSPNYRSYAKEAISRVWIDHIYLHGGFSGLQKMIDKFILRKNVRRVAIPSSHIFAMSSKVFELLRKKWLYTPTRLEDFEVTCTLTFPLDLTVGFRSNPDDGSFYQKHPTANSVMTVKKLPFERIVLSYKIVD